MAATQFTIRRKILTILGAKFHIYNADGALLGFCKQKAFKLREDIRIYSDESMREERVAIKARSILDFSAAYDIVDGASQKRLGTLKRQGLTSMFRDQWIVFDENESQVGVLQEDSMALALVRRFLSNLVPQHFALKNGSGVVLADYKTHFNPFVHRMTVQVTENCPPQIADVLLAQFSLGPEDLYRVDGPVNLVRLMNVPDGVARPDLKYPVFRPGLPARLEGHADLFAAIREGDLLLYHPFQAFQPVIAFLEQAARDPAVVALRDRVTATVTPGIGEAQVTAVITLRDGRRLEQHVAHVVGSVERPMSDADLDRKFLDLAEGVLAPQRARQLIDLCRTVDRLPDAGALARAAAAE